MAWRFLRKIEKEVAGSGWGESGGVPWGHVGDNFLLTESGLRTCLGGAVDVSLAFGILDGFIPRVSGSEAGLGAPCPCPSSATNALCDFMQAALSV